MHHQFPDAEKERLALIREKEGVLREIREIERAERDARLNEPEDFDFTEKEFLEECESSRRNEAVIGGYKYVPMPPKIQRKYIDENKSLVDSRRRDRARQNQEKELEEMALKEDTRCRDFNNRVKEVLANKKISLVCLFHLFSIFIYSTNLLFESNDKE